MKASGARKFADLRGGVNRGLQDGIDRPIIKHAARGRHCHGVGIGSDGAVGCVHLPGAGEFNGHDQSGFFFHDHGHNLWVPAGDRLKNRISIPVKQAVLLALAVQCEHSGAGEIDLHGVFCDHCIGHAAAGGRSAQGLIICQLVSLAKADLSTWARIARRRQRRAPVCGGRRVWCRGRCGGCRPGSCSPTTTATTAA